jgi:hypothetical protein
LNSRRTTISKGYHRKGRHPEIAQEMADRSLGAWPDLRGGFARAAPPTVHATRVSVVIVNYNGGALLGRTVRAIREGHGAAEIVVVGTMGQRTTVLPGFGPSRRVTRKRG